MPTKPVPSAAQDRIQSVKTPFQESPVLEPEPGLHCSQSLQASPPALNAPPARHGHRDASGCGTEGVVHGRATRLSIDDARAPPSDPQARIQSAPLQQATVDLVEPIRRASDGSTLLFQSRRDGPPPRESALPLRALRTISSAPESARGPERPGRAQAMNTHLHAKWLLMCLGRSETQRVH